MDNYTATEQAYKNGYEQGLKDAVKEGEWVFVYRVSATDILRCSCCGVPFYNKTSYCPRCGARMKG